MIIVTGGAGFIGSNIVKALNDKGITDILVVDNLKDGTKFVNLVDLNIADYMDKEDFLIQIMAGEEFGDVEAIFHEGACSSTTEWDGNIRIPVVSSPKARRIEVRFPDPAANPYLCFAALLMAGLDGIKNKIHPGEAMDKNLYDLPPEEAKEIPQVAGSLEEALNELDLDREFLKAGGVFTDEAIDAYIALRREEDDRVRMTPHPVEFELYYSV